MPSRSQHKARSASTTTARTASFVVTNRIVALFGLAESLLLAINNHSTVIYVVGLLSVSIVPGWSLVSPISNLSLPLRLALGTSLSWASLLLVAQVTLSSHLWNPRITVTLVMLASSTVLGVRDPLVRRRSRA